MRWINEKLLDPQSLLTYGKRILKSERLLSHEITLSDHTSTTENTLNLRMANIPSLTKEKHPSLYSALPQTPTFMLNLDMNHLMII